MLAKVKEYTFNIACMLNIYLTNFKYNNAIYKINVHKRSKTLSLLIYSSAPNIVSVLKISYFQQ